MPVDDGRDRERERALFKRVCPDCGSSLVLESVYPDTKRPERFACSDRNFCATLWRVDYESHNWDLVSL
jgi:hypothetical protein